MCGVDFNSCLGEDGLMVVSLVEIRRWSNMRVGDSCQQKRLRQFYEKVDVLGCRGFDGGQALKMRSDGDGQGRSRSEGVQRTERQQMYKYPCGILTEYEMLLK